MANSRVKSLFQQSRDTTLNARKFEKMSDNITQDSKFLNSLLILAKIECSTPLGAHKIQYESELKRQAHIRYPFFKNQRTHRTSSVIALHSVTQLPGTLVIVLLVPTSIDQSNNQYGLFD
jgi:hypothetical protein